MKNLTIEAFLEKVSNSDAESILELIEDFQNGGFSIEDYTASDFNGSHL